ncbi:hypothetical protein GCM10012289_48740 [Nonomuraea cavernae]|uniref:Cas12f1-like TNB domain-containing protein n=1 Tax=Nonomuraea cavernae TaxID=2045107 RepID=A0A918DP31_9ACTN|nr:hypothetical protein GCM10012289_48740 [Nonomuraea cavernae]
MLGTDPESTRALRRSPPQPRADPLEPARSSGLPRSLRPSERTRALRRSKLCSACGAVTRSLPLNVRKWTCPCGAVHDRDVNAAINILAAGRADSLNACGGKIRRLAEDRAR